MGPYRRATFYLWGFVQVFGQVFLVSLLLLWLLQFAAFAIGSGFDPAPVFQHLLLMFSFLVFYPGQTFWTHTREGPDGKTYVIVGANDPV